MMGNPWSEPPRPPNVNPVDGGPYAMALENPRMSPRAVLAAYAENILNERAKQKAPPKRKTEWDFLLEEDDDDAPTTIEEVTEDGT